MTIFEKRRLKKRLWKLGKENWEISKKLLAYGNVPDEELPNFFEKYPLIYGTIIEWSEELYKLGVEEANIFLKLNELDLYKAELEQLDIITNSIWTLKSVAATA